MILFREDPPTTITVPDHRERDRATLRHPASGGNHSGGVAETLVTRQYDRVTKENDRKKAGVRQDWLIDPPESKTTCCVRQCEKLDERATEDDTIASIALRGFTLDLSPVRQLLVRRGPKAACHSDEIKDENEASNVQEELVKLHASHS